MQRRQFIALLGGTAAAWPLDARAQGERVRRVGMLLPATADDSEYPILVRAFVQGLHQLGWTDGSNIRIDIRWARGGVGTNRKYAEELVALAPDVIMAAVIHRRGRCCRPHGPYQSFLRSFPMRSVPDLWTVLHNLAATLPASQALHMTLVGNGWTYSRRLRRT